MRYEARTFFGETPWRCEKYMGRSREILWGWDVDVRGSGSCMSGKLNTLKEGWKSLPSETNRNCLWSVGIDTRFKKSCNSCIKILRYFNIREKGRLEPCSFQTWAARCAFLCGRKICSGFSIHWPHQHMLQTRAANRCIF